MFESELEIEFSPDGETELAAFVLGGIGIFLIGIHYAGSHLQKITGGFFQKLLTKVSGHPIGMFAAGATLGFMIRSGRRPNQQQVLSNT